MEYFIDRHVLTKSRFKKGKLETTIMVENAPLNDIENVDLKKWMYRFKITVGSLSVVNCISIFECGYWYICYKNPFTRRKCQ